MRSGEYSDIENKINLRLNAMQARKAKEYRHGKITKQDFKTTIQLSEEFRKMVKR